MSTNIDSTHGPEIIKQWIEEFARELQETLPTKLLIIVPKTIMTNNVFQFDDTY
jgi:hypothetical protein